MEQRIFFVLQLETTYLNQTLDRAFFPPQIPIFPFKLPHRGVIAAWFPLEREKKSCSRHHHFTLGREKERERDQ